MYRRADFKKLVSVMAAKSWSIQDSKRKNGSIVEFWLAYKQNIASVVVTYTNDKLVDVAGEDSLPQYIITDMQSYLASISVFGVVAWDYASTASSLKV